MLCFSDNLYCELSGNLEQVTGPPCVSVFWAGVKGGELEGI